MKYYSLLLITTALLQHQSFSSYGLSLQKHAARTKRTTLNAEPKKLGRKEGVYSRPSGAIERGSGFFVPGLEGPKIRIASGSVILLAVVANHVLSDGKTTALEGLAVFYAALVLLQGLVQFRGENLEEGEESQEQQQKEPMSNTISYQQVWSVPVENAEWRDRVEWVAKTLTSLTPCTHAILVSSEAMIYSLGRTHIDKNTDLVSTAMETIGKSTTGRIALPANHPIISYMDPKFRKTVILQRCEPGMCWIFSSDQILAAFTSSDLKWIGNIGEYASIEQNVYNS